MGPIIVQVHIISSSPSIIICVTLFLYYTVSQTVIPSSQNRVSLTILNAGNAIFMKIVLSIISHISVVVFFFFQLSEKIM